MVGYLTRPACLQLLVDKGADLDTASNKDGRIAIMWPTIMGGRLTCLQYLVDRVNAAVEQLL